MAEKSEKSLLKIPLREFPDFFVRDVRRQDKLNEDILKVLSCKIAETALSGGVDGFVTSVNSGKGEEIYTARFALLSERQWESVRELEYQVHCLELNTGVAVLKDKVASLTDEITKLRAELERAKQ